MTYVKTDPNDVEFKYAFKILYNNKSHILAASSQEELNDWVDQLRNCVSEKVLTIKRQRSNLTNLLSSSSKSTLPVQNNFEDFDVEVLAKISRGSISSSQNSKNKRESVFKSFLFDKPQDEVETDKNGEYGSVKKENEAEQEKEEGDKREDVKTEKESFKDESCKEEESHKLKTTTEISDSSLDVSSGDLKKEEEMERVKDVEEDSLNGRETKEGKDQVESHFSSPFNTSKSLGELELISMAKNLVLDEESLGTLFSESILLSQEELRLSPIKADPQRNDTFLQDSIEESSPETRGQESTIDTETKQNEVDFDN